MRIQALLTAAAINLKRLATALLAIFDALWRFLGTPAGRSCSAMATMIAA
jgi:hypothetical protein